MLSDETRHRSSPACGTCRRKCRRCDRGRPHCKRCLDKGLACEGYPTQFKLYNRSLTPRRPRTKRRTTTSTAEESPQSLSKATQNSPTTSLSSALEGSSDTLSSTSPSHNTSPQQWNTSPSSSTSQSGLLDNILSQKQSQDFLTHFDVALCDILSTDTTIHPSPFRAYILPLAYQNLGLLHAVLGLAACHMSTSADQSTQRGVTAALEHKLQAIQALGSLLLKEECFGLHDSEEEIALSMVLILVLHDICESGRSLHGTHLNGVAFLCSRIVARTHGHTAFRNFLLASLSWLDILRGFSGAEKLAFSQEVRQHVVDADDFSLETTVGCPADLFLQIGEVLEAGKSYLSKEIELAEFEAICDEAEAFLRNWDLDQDIYPNSAPEWRLLANAYRHACILRVLRFPDAFATSCNDSRIQDSVRSILEACAQISWSSPLYKRVLFPLFVAGAETNSVHQQHYPAVMQILNMVWKERSKIAQSANGPQNVPWTEYTCSTLLQRQHDYLFF